MKVDALTVSAQPYDEAVIYLDRGSGGSKIVTAWFVRESELELLSISEDVCYHYVTCEKSSHPF